ncbi:ACT domain-containing protein [Deltaproteobacteria bacterium Smac51]|nr:ACT domain-containing protein [Deltaproteobacteria bacterium Smac51]
MRLIKLDGDFSVSKLPSADNLDLGREFSFLSITDDEISYVCKSEFVPADAVETEHDWKALKISGTLDFGMIGVIAKISGLLAEQKISIFVVSTFNTDYILVKKSSFEKTLNILSSNGYEIV